MHARNELNLTLYQQKMDGDRLPRYNDEYRFYHGVRQGDKEEAALLGPGGALRLRAKERPLSGNALMNLCYHFVLEASALARVCMEGGLSHDEAHTLSDIYIRKLDKVKGQEDIHRLYGQMCLDYAARMGEIRKEAAISRHVRKCVDHIYENLGGDLSLGALAKLTGLNPSYLSRLFSREMGRPLRQFVLEARIDTAQHLLKHSDLSCARIAASLGFSSQSAFIAVFGKFAHTTPGAYRESHARRGVGNSL